MLFRSESHKAAAVPTAVAATIHAAWKAPKTCHVAGDTADDPIWPTRGMAQGDSSASKSLCGVLAPWRTQGKAFLFMDDRSLVASSWKQLQEDIEDTNRFDEETGALENEGKRQVWRRGEAKKIEHIGIMATPDNPSEDITPAAGWQKLERCLKKISSIRGPRETRCKLVVAYAKPLWSWCSPVFALPPMETVKNTMKARISRLPLE